MCVTCRILFHIFYFYFLFIYFYYYYYFFNLNFNSNNHHFIYRVIIPIIVFHYMKLKSAQKFFEIRAYATFLTFNSLTSISSVHLTDNIRTCIGNDDDQGVYIINEGICICNVSRVCFS